MSTRDFIRDLGPMKLELQDDHILEQFWFAEDGHIVASLGTKGGGVCGPILNYKVTGDRSVEIVNSKGNAVYRWEEAQVEGDTLRVLCDGSVKTFRITKAPRKERWLP